MSLVREVSLRTIDSSPRLVQQVAADPAALAGPAKSFRLQALEISDGEHLLDGAAGTVQCIHITITPGTAEELGLIVRGDGTRGTRIGIRPAEGSILVDRRESGQTGFHENFASVDAAPIRATNGSYEITVYVDRCSVEIFAQGGHVTLTELIFPTAASTDVSVYAIRGTATINELQITQYA